jgi:hypothetical protein
MFDSSLDVRKELDNFKPTKQYRLPDLKAS